MGAWEQRIGWLAGVSMASLMAAVASSASADDAAADAAVEEVIVTGTRQTGLKVEDSPAPVQVVDTAALARTGQTDLRLGLANVAPSFNAQAFGGDTANLTLSARLRGLSPNHALVLINGKRRHTTSNLAVLPGDVTVALGANNLFNKYPEKLSAKYQAACIAGGGGCVTQYPGFSPYGINGGYYYGRLTWAF